MDNGLLMGGLSGIGRLHGYINEIGRDFVPDMEEKSLQIRAINAGIGEITFCRPAACNMAPAAGMAPSATQALVWQFKRGGKNPPP